LVFLGISRCYAAQADATLRAVARILVIDNYDSFVYNLVQYLGQLGAEPLVYRNDAIDLSAARALEPDGLLISPGPGRPESAGASLALISEFAGAVPVLGVCLGHQCIGEVFGGRVVRAPVMHGKTSVISHDGRGLFAGVPEPLVATRYHSLVVEAGPVPPVLEVSAWSGDGTVMGLRHRTQAVEGLQFHPESILTEGGHRLLANWLAVCGQADALAAVPAAVASLGPAVSARPAS
jgi:anthranilate synthase/aminodeoxychorismate synthase-like glutamine amidotransferase